MKRFFMLFTAAAFICGTVSAATAVTTTTSSDECNKVNLENWKAKRIAVYNERKALTTSKNDKALKTEKNAEHKKLTKKIRSCAAKLKNAKNK